MGRIIEEVDFTLEVPTVNYKKTITLVVKEKCSCKKSNPAKSFVGLVELVKQAEDMLIKNGYDGMEDRLNIIRGIYYGAEWSLDYNVEKSSFRNVGFNTYTNSPFSKPVDARKVLKCDSDCKADLFNSLYQSFEVFDNQYKAVDFGHLIIGMESRCNWYPSKIPMPATGLEMNTWVGDLGGGTAKLAFDRIKNPKKRAKTLFPVSGNSYGAMVNLEGDIAGYVVGMNKNKPNKIADPRDSYKTIHEALKDYFDNLWDKRGLYFLQMLDGKFEGNVLKNKSEILLNCAKSIENFAYFYLSIRMNDKKMGTMKDFSLATENFKPISNEVSLIFIEAIENIIKNPHQAIIAVSDPSPTLKQETSISKGFKKAEEVGKKIKTETKNFIDNIKRKF